MRGWAFLLLPMATNACVPPAVVVASYAADGASYVATGKTVSDHGISAATMRDCSLLRVVKDEAICSDVPAAGAPAPLDDRRIAGPATPSGVPSAMPAASTQAGRYLVVGSYADRGKAERAARDFAEFTPAIRVHAADARPVHRVVVGPLDAAAVGLVRERSPGAWRAAPPLTAQRE
jgi:hypothetical protein